MEFFFSRNSRCLLHTSLEHFSCTRHKECGFCIVIVLDWTLMFESVDMATFVGKNGHQEEVCWYCEIALCAQNKSNRSIGSIVDTIGIVYVIV